MFFLALQILQCEKKHYFYSTALIQTSASHKLNLKRKILLAVKNHHLLYFGHEKNVDQKVTENVKPRINRKKMVLITRFHLFFHARLMQVLHSHVTSNNPGPSECSFF